MSRATRPRTSLRWEHDCARWWARILGVRAVVLRRCVLGRWVSLRAARRVERVLVEARGELARRRATGRWT